FKDLNTGRVLTIAQGKSLLLSGLERECNGGIPIKQVPALSIECEPGSIRVGALDPIDGRRFDNLPARVHDAQVQIVGRWCRIRPIVTDHVRILERVRQGQRHGTGGDPRRCITGGLIPGTLNPADVNQPEFLPS
ncbi:hypothetical protein BVRB_042360, partial [Beta vulgaris subsp. vulgaris]